MNSGDHGTKRPGLKNKSPMRNRQSILVLSDQTFPGQMDANNLGLNRSASSGKWIYTIWFKINYQKFGYELTKSVQKLKYILGYKTTCPWIRKDQPLGTKRPNLLVRNVQGTERPATFLFLVFFINERGTAMLRISQLGDCFQQLLYLWKPVTFYLSNFHVNKSILSALWKFGNLEEVLDNNNFTDIHYF